MGIRICNPPGEIILLQAFAAREQKRSTVQLWCNVQTNEHNLVVGKPSYKKQAVMAVEFSVPVFRTIAANGTDELKTFAKKIKPGRSQTFSRQPLPLDAAMHQCIYSIMHYEGEEAAKTMYLYTRVIELLMLQQQSYLRATTTQPRYVKTEYDKERIVFARDYLLTHMDAPPALPELAAIAGINEFKLKRGFRELFNDSVFGYLADVRLQMARTALQQKQKTVTQIAFQLGYASLQHFSAAFKKKFGVSPREFK